ncbi:hypothetical protein MHK_005170 [Candidatus Magnetomorum sp. HK-1]|nr:hypothetical protein MHK_005170 [Candidatus Magnetomorum sp. HK-1]
MTGLLSQTVYPVSFPIFRAFQQFKKKSLQKIQARLSELTKDKETVDNNLYCVFCRHQISSLNFTIQINGNHHHMFTNPQGIAFEISCFSQAPGCAQTGTPTLEYTWFHGYNWRYALCAKCQMHLGWFYQSDNHNFYGLIMKSLIGGNQS